jgi:two-component system NarL family response regulator
MILTTSSSASPPDAEQTRTVRILLVDAHRIFRQALRTLLSADTELTVVGEAGRAAESLELIATLRPDVVITDLHLPDAAGADFIERIGARFPGTAVLVLTALRARGIAAAARRAGARGYLLKEEGREELWAALREVLAGRWYCSLINPTARRRGRRHDENSLSERAAYLTDRQRQVLRSLALGHTTREIARVLGVSTRAVHRQRERLRLTLQLDSTAALTRFALREGFIEEHSASC